MGGFSGPGALFMYAITAVLAFGLAVAVERFWVFWIQWRVDSAGVLDLVSKGQLDAAGDKAGSHPVAALVKAGAAATSADAAWDAMGSEAAIVESKVRQRVPYLATVGNISTMLGLLGTVYGLIIAFTGLADATAIERTTNLSEGIATAMATTAWGLMVGIPALAVHAFVDGKANRILSWCEAVAGQVALHRRG